MQFIRSPLLHKLDQISLNYNKTVNRTIIKWKPYAQRKHKRKMKRLKKVTDDNYQIEIPTEILMEILTFSNDYYDHLLSMHRDLAIYQYIIPQILDLIQFVLVVILLITPPNCIFFSVLFNIYNMNNSSHSILSEYYNIFNLNIENNEYEYHYTDHELLGYILCIASVLQLSGCFAALIFNYNTEYIEKWILIKNILYKDKNNKNNNNNMNNYPFELLFPFQKWCCIHRNYYLLPHSNFNNLRLLKQSIHSVFWKFINPLSVYVIYCLFKPLLSFMLSVYYWQIYRFSMNNESGLEIIFFLMMIWLFGIFLYRDVLRIIVDGWIGSRISCLIIAECYLQIYCNNDYKYKTAQNFEIINILLWMIAAAIYKFVEYLIMNLYFKSYIHINHLTKHSLQQFIYDWYSAFFILLVYCYGFGFLFACNPGEFFTFSQSINSILRLIIGVLIYIDAQLDILIFDKTIQKMSKLDVLKQILFAHNISLMKDWRQKFK